MILGPNLLDSQKKQGGSISSFHYMRESMQGQLKLNAQESEDISLTSCKAFLNEYHLCTGYVLLHDKVVKRKLLLHDKVVKRKLLLHDKVVKRKLLLHDKVVKRKLLLL